MCETGRERAHTYTLVQPRVNRGRQTNIDQIIAFFIGQKTGRKLIFIGCSFDLKRGKRKGRKKENRSERARTHIAFISFSPPTDTRIHTKVVHTNMSPTCMIKPKQSIYQQKSKPKYIKNKPSKENICKLQLSLHICVILEDKIQGSMTTTETKQEIDEHIYIELDIKCR